MSERLRGLTLGEAIRVASLLGISDLGMRAFIVAPEVIEWACQTPEVGRLLDALAHFDATPGQVEEVAP